MRDPESGETWIEYVRSQVPKGDLCGMCGFLTAGVCQLFGQRLTGSRKVKQCVGDKYINMGRHDEDRRHNQA